MQEPGNRNYELWETKFVVLVIKFPRAGECLTDVNILKEIYMSNILVEAVSLGLKFNCNSE